MTIDNILDDKLITRLKQENIDIDVFVKLLSDVVDDVDRKDIKNWDNWLKAVIDNIIKQNKAILVKRPTVVDITLLKKRMKEAGFKRSIVNGFLLELIISHCVNEFPIKQEEMQSAINEVFANCKEKTYKNFIAYLLKHQLIVSRVNIPLEQLIKEAKRHAEEYQELIKDINSVGRHISIDEALNRKELHGDTITEESETTTRR